MTIHRFSHNILFIFSEEEKKEGEEEAPKAEEAGEGGEAPKPEGEEQPKEDGEAAAGGAEVTVEVDVEEGADKGQIQNLLLSYYE